MINAFGIYIANGFPVMECLLYQANLGTGNVLKHLAIEAVKPAGAKYLVFVVVQDNGQEWTIKPSEAANYSLLPITP